MSTDMHLMHPTSRRKLEGSQSILRYYRSFCDITGRIPMRSYHCGPTTLLVCSNGIQVTVFDAESLNVVFSYSSGILVEIIEIEAINDQVIILYLDGSIKTISRGQLVRESRIQDFERTNFLSMRNYGGEIFLLLKDRIIILDTSLNITTVMDFVSLGITASAVCCSQPRGYTNKLVVGFADGNLLLLNYKSHTIVYTFTCHGRVPITVIEASRIPDVVAISGADNTVWICDLLHDLKLFSFSCGIPVTCMSFYNDQFESTKDFLVTGTSMGEICVWSLERQNLMFRFPGHRGPVVSVLCLGNQYSFASSGCDNSLMEWAVSANEVSPLRGRSGMTATPQTIQFYGDDAILSMGAEGTPYYCSIIKDSQSKSFSNGPFGDPDSNKVPLLSVFDRNELKWDNIVTALEGNTVALSWRGEHKRLGAFQFSSDKEDKISSVAISTCGNYAILGFQEGSIRLFNLQSGQLWKSANISSVEPIMLVGTDLGASTLIALARSGTLNIFHLPFFKRESIRIAEIAEIKKAKYFPDLDWIVMFVIDDEDFSCLAIYDLECRSVIRKLKIRGSTVQDFTISADALCLLAATSDCQIKMWNLEDSELIDSYETAFIPRSLATSVNSSLLAFSMNGSRGIHVLINSSLIGQRSMATRKMISNNQEFPSVIHLENSGTVSQQGLGSTHEDGKTFKTQNTFLGFKNPGELHALTLQRQKITSQLTILESSFHECLSILSLF